MTDVEALIAEARGFIAGSDPDSARTTLIRDLADALETVLFYGSLSSCTREYEAEMLKAKQMKANYRDPLASKDPDEAMPLPEEACDHEDNFCVGVDAHSAMTESKRREHE